MPIPRFLKSRSTWSLFVSMIAVALSQSPPVANWFRGQKVTLRVSKECFMGHTLGDPILQFTVDIRNVGGRSAEFTDIDCFLKKSTGEIINLPIKAYLQSTPNSQSSNSFTKFPITIVSLRPGERWNAIVTGYNEWNEADEELLNTIKTAVFNDIRAQQVKVKWTDATWYEAESSHVKQAMDFFNAHFKITQGQYVLYVALKRDEQVLAVAAYPLVIYRHHIDYLRSLADDYKWGSGLLPNFSQQRGDLKLILNRPLSDADAARGYAAK